MAFTECGQLRQPGWHNPSIHFHKLCQLIAQGTAERDASLVAQVWSASCFVASLETEGRGTCESTKDGLKEGGPLLKSCAILTAQCPPWSPHLIWEHLQWSGSPNRARPGIDSQSTNEAAGTQGDASIRTTAAPREKINQNQKPPPRRGRV